MDYNDNPLLNTTAIENRPFLKTIIKLETDIDILKKCYDKNESDPNFRTNNLFSKKFTSELQKYFEDIGSDLKELQAGIMNLEHKIVSGNKNNIGFLKICLYIAKLLNNVKQVLLDFRLKMTSSGKYMDNNSVYYRAFPLTIYDDIELLILSVDTLLIKSEGRVLND